jgi:Gluconate 2-dehydrogenase subunit 3
VDNKLQRRAFMKGAAAGALTITVGGIDAFRAARIAHAQAAPFRVFTADEAGTIEALGETLVPGARSAGVAHFVDHQLSLAPSEALLEARILNIRPPFVEFYRSAIGAVDRASHARHGLRFAQLTADQRHQVVDLMRQARLDGWQGPSGPLVYLVTRSDAVDVVYGTMEGYAALGIPYMPHIAPKQRW